MGLADPASIRLVAKEAGCPVFFVPDEKSDLNNLAAIAQELPASVALMGLGQAASAGKMAASVARP